MFGADAFCNQLAKTSELAAIDPACVTSEMRELASYPKRLPGEDQRVPSLITTLPGTRGPREPLQVRALDRWGHIDVRRPVDYAEAPDRM